MENFPGNSRKSIEQRNAEASEEKKEVKLERVVSGKVIKRKKSLGRRILDTFFSGDSNSVIGYLGREVLLPALQNLLTDFVTQGVEKAVYGEVRSNNRTTYRGSVPRTHVSYDRPSSIVRSPSYNAQPPRRPATQPSAFDVGEIILDSKISAEMVSEKLTETIEEYGAATVANLNDLIGQTSAYTDHKWGWTDLSTMDIKRIKEGYLLLLPEPEDLR